MVSLCPVLTIDPLCVVDNYHDHSHLMEDDNNMVGSILTKTGSHLPFYEGLFLNNWAERLAFEFFDAYLLVEQEKQAAGVKE